MGHGKPLWSRIAPLIDFGYAGVCALELLKLELWSIGQLVDMVGGR